MPAPLLQRLRARLDGPGAAMLGYVVRLLVYLGVFTYGIDRLPAGLAAWVKDVTAGLTAALFVPFTDAIVHRSGVVTYAGFSVRIIEECFGLLEMAIFAAAVLAFAAPWRARLIGLAAGLPLIYAFNLLRIAMLLVVGHYWPTYFDFTHLYFWQGTLIAMITGLWLLWVRYVVRA